MLNRLFNWQTQLHGFIEANRQTKFQYGALDCCSFVTSAIEVMTGVDLYSPFRGKYASQKESLQALRAYAGKASIKAVVKRITTDNNMPLIPVSRAQRGDVALIRRKGNHYSLGIISMTGMDVLVVTGEGLTRVPLDMAAQCWRV